MLRLQNVITPGELAQYNWMIYVVNWHAIYFQITSWYYQSELLSHILNVATPGCLVIDYRATTAFTVHLHGRKSNTVVNLLTNIHERHPIARPNGWSYWCFISVHVIIYVYFYNIGPRYDGTRLQYLQTYSIKLSHWSMSHGIYMFMMSQSMQNVSHLELFVKW